METMRSGGKRRACIELDKVKENEDVQNVYEKIDKRNVNNHTYDNVKIEKKTKNNNTSQEKMDRTEVVIVLLCVVVAALVIAAVIVSSVVFFGVTDGGWTDWEDWGACSVTCGTGFTTRIRTCSNPRPSIMGRYCDGTSLQVQSCNNMSCSGTDGGWTGWEDWGACSVTCGAGITSRIRACSSPRPPIMGRYCDGTFVQVQTCNSGSCSVTDDSWTDWGNWGVCSVTCGVGLITRSRTCSNSQPSLTGRYCDGTSEQTEICNDTPCSGDSVGFSVQQPYSDSRENRLTFHTALYNYNDVFNTSSGEFVCQKEGLYLFISTILRIDNTINYISCNFYKNNNQFIGYASYASSNNASDSPSSASSILHPLKPGDRVYLGCKGVRYIAKASGFTGLLINPMH